MRREAVIVVKGAALLALSLAMSGCATTRAFPRPGSKMATKLAQRSAQCQTLSREAQSAIDQHDDGSAVAILQQLVAMEPQSAEAHHRLGKVLQSQGRLVEAEQQYRRALDYDREYVAAMTSLGSIDGV